MNDRYQQGAVLIAPHAAIALQFAEPVDQTMERKGLTSLPLAGYPILSARAAPVMHVLKDRLATSQKTVLLFANTNFVMQCRSLLPWLHSKEVLLLNDGVGLDIAALLKHGRRYKANLNGTDFVPSFLKNLPAQQKIFLYGGKPGVAMKAAIAIERDIGQQVVGCMDGYTEPSSETLCKLINRSGANIVLVALGNPIQEGWIRSNMQALDAKLLVGVGALFDFLSGEVARAPNWVQDIRCEWIYRLMQEPKRLLKRYTVDIFSFLYLCMRKQPQTA